MVDTRLEGSCKALYCMDIAQGIDLALAQLSLTAASRTGFHHKSRVPEGSGMAQPLRLSWETPIETIGRFSTSAEVNIALYEMGALCITWSIPFAGPPEDLVELSTTLYDNSQLIASSRELAVKVMSTLTPALDRAQLASFIEDYVIFQTGSLAEGPEELLLHERPALARILRAEQSQLSSQEVEDALANPVSYGLHDVCLVDWLAAFLMGRDMEDERLVLELATVELLELRLLDARLEEQIQGAYKLLGARSGLWGALTLRRRELEQVARIQAEDAILHEGIDNALKLFGDDYLARLYQTSGRRFHFEEWDRSVQRKLDVLRSIHQSLADVAAHSRAELLEWIIILLIAVDILLYFTPLR